MTNTDKDTDKRTYETLWGGPSEPVSRCEDGAGGGGRTHTRFEPHGILSPARLPVPPLRHFLQPTEDTGLLVPTTGSRTACWHFSPPPPPAPIPRLRDIDDSTLRPLEDIRGGVSTGSIARPQDDGQRPRDKRPEGRAGGLIVPREFRPARRVGDDAAEAPLRGVRDDADRGDDRRTDARAVVPTQGRVLRPPLTVLHATGFTRAAVAPTGAPTIRWGDRLCSPRVSWRHGHRPGATQWALAECDTGPAIHPLHFGHVPARMRRRL